MTQPGLAAGHRPLPSFFAGALRPKRAFNRALERDSQERCLEAEVSKVIYSKCSGSANHGYPPAGMHPKVYKWASARRNDNSYRNSFAETFDGIKTRVGCEGSPNAALSFTVLPSLP